MKKKLLSEAQVRRFMGLAGINPLNEMADYKKDDEPMAEMMHNEGEEDLMEEEDEEMDVEMEDDMEDKGGDADVEMDEEDLADVKSALDTLQDKLAPLLDQAEGGEDMDMGGDEEPEMDMGDEEEPEMDMGGEEGEDDMEKELQEVDMELTEEEEKEQMEEIVNEVARHVAKRIVEAKRAHKRMTEALGRKK